MGYYRHHQPVSMTKAQGRSLQNNYHHHHYRHQHHHHQHQHHQQHYHHHHHRHHHHHHQHHHHHHHHHQPVSMPIALLNDQNTAADYPAEPRRWIGAWLSKRYCRPRKNTAQTCVY